METVIGWVALAFVGLVLILVVRSDLPRWRGSMRTVQGEVVGHRSSFDDNTRSYAAVFRFSAEGATHDVVDQVYVGTVHPPVGEKVSLSYPAGRPDLARVPRPLTWLAVYAFLIFAIWMLVTQVILPQA